MEVTEARPIRHFSVKRVSKTESKRVLDTVAAEEPLAISIRHWFKNRQLTESFAVTMRTPGHDSELAMGLLLSEGIIRRRAELAELRLLGTGPSNEILVELARDSDFEAWRQQRNSFVSPSCGVCGKRSRESITQNLPRVREDELRVSGALIERLPDLLQGRQEGFAETGGLHAAASVTAQGTVDAVFEDIGRHNALDKLIGWALLNERLPLCDSILFLSSRSSFELIQKAAMAGAPLLATVGGPSSLAIETARELGMTLIGFVRGGRFNVYSGDWRIDS
jgi:FdhD protein